MLRQCEGDHDSLASMSRRAAGAASCTASTRGRSRLSPPSLSFRMGAFAFALAAVAIAAGVFRLIVNDVSTARTMGMFASSQTRLPEAFASTSHNAQSNALRAAPADSRCWICCRFILGTLFIDSIFAKTDAALRL